MSSVLVPLLAALAVLVGGVGQASAAGNEQINSYDVSLDLHKDGSLKVSEKVVYDFGSSQRHGFERDIPVQGRYGDSKKYDRVLKVEDVSGTRDGKKTPVSTKTDNGTEIIRLGDPKKNVTGKHTYVLSYTARGVMNKIKDTEELNWNAIGTSFAVPIASANVTLKTPADITRVTCYQGTQNSKTPCGNSSSTGAAARYSGSSLGNGQGLSIVAALPAGTVPSDPILQERFSVARSFGFNAVSVPVTLAVLLLGLGGAAWMYWTRGRDRRYAGQIPGLTPVAGQSGQTEFRPLFQRGDGSVEFRPPDDIRPGEAGTLIDERADVVDVTATIVDLAVRGFLHIEELPREGKRSNPDWKLTNLHSEKTGELRLYERTLFGDLFETGDEVLLSDLKNTFAEDMADIRRRLYDTVVQRGWFHSSPEATRKAFLTLGGFLAIAGVAACILLSKARLHFALAGVALVLVGVVVMIVSRYMPAKTADGSAVYARVEGFRRYLRTAEAEQIRFEERVQIFSRYLPYAMVFGETERMAKIFADLAAADPAGAGAGMGWYGAPNGWSMLYLGASLNSFSSTSASSLVSTPAPSGGGFGGGSGFGGGGFAGGGMGGGGGGSW